MVLMCAIAWMRYCEADKWVRLKSPNKHTEELVWYGIDCLQPLLSQNGSCLFLRILKDYFKLSIKTAFFCGSFRNLDQRGSNLLTTEVLNSSGNPTGNLTTPVAPYTSKPPFVMYCRTSSTERRSSQLPLSLKKVLRPVTPKSLSRLIRPIPTRLPFPSLLRILWRCEMIYIQLWMLV
jgi:hypothetical protein